MPAGLTSDQPLPEGGGQPGHDLAPCLWRPGNAVLLANHVRTLPCMVRSCCAEEGIGGGVAAARCAPARRRRLAGVGCLWSRDVWPWPDGHQADSVGLVPRGQCWPRQDTNVGGTGTGEATMTAEQGGGVGGGRVPALNIERLYSTTIPAGELARALADHFGKQEFEVQVFRSSEDRTVMQARKESLWRHLLGVSYALTVVFTPRE